MDKVSIARLFSGPDRVKPPSLDTHNNVMLSLYYLLKAYRTTFGQPVPGWALQYYCEYELRELLSDALETGTPVAVFQGTDNILPIEWIYIPDPKAEAFLDGLDLGRP
jgi:hypothetical protein